MEKIMITSVVVFVCLFSVIMGFSLTLGGIFLVINGNLWGIIMFIVGLALLSGLIGFFFAEV